MEFGELAEELVFVVEDDRGMRTALERLLRAHGLEVQTFGSAQEFLEQQKRVARARCLVLDLRMPGLTGMELQERLRDDEATIPIVFVTGHGDVPSSVRAMRRGAEDFLEKPFDERDLLDAIERALARDRSERADRARREEARARLESLTAREREVFDLVVRGFLNKQIAGELGAAVKTVKVHRGRVMRKMEADSLAHLVQMATHLGVADDEPV